MLVTSTTYNKIIQSKITFIIKLQYVEVSVAHINVAIESRTIHIPTANIEASHEIVIKN